VGISLAENAVDAKIPACAGMTATDFPSHYGKCPLTPKIATVFEQKTPDFSCSVNLNLA
jgi:hypothetical protein